MSRQNAASSQVDDVGRRWDCKATDSNTKHPTVERAVIKSFHHDTDVYFDSLNRELAALDDLQNAGYRNLLDVLRLDGCLAWHAVNLGSGSGFSVVFSLPKHDFTDAQMVAFDKIMIDYTDHQDFA